MLNNIGVRAHDYGKSTIEDLAVRIKRDGYKTTQLALKKALIDSDKLESVLNKAYSKKINRVVTKAGIETSVLGAYLNYAGLDDTRRSYNIIILKKHIEIAKTLGCRMVGTETGSLNDDYSPHDENHGEAAYLRFKEVIEEAVNLADKEGIYLAVEAVSHHIIHTPERMNRLVRDINKDCLKVIFDISNLMTEDNWKEQEEIMSQAFRLLADKILVVHVKDFDFIDGKKVIVPLGQGKLNLDFLMEEVKKSSEKIDLLGENVREDKLKETYDIIASYFE